MTVLPEDSFKNIGHGEGGLTEYNNENHMCPRVLTKLIFVHLLFQCKNEPNKSCSKNKYVLYIQNFDYEFPTHI